MEKMTIKVSTVIIILVVTAALSSAITFTVMRTERAVTEAIVKKKEKEDASDRAWKEYNSHQTIDTNNGKRF